MKYLILLVYATISSYGLYKLKAEELLSLPFLIGFGFYGLGMLIWLGILRTTPISVAFPVAAGSLIIATQLIERYRCEDNHICLGVVEKPP